MGAEIAISLASTDDKLSWDDYVKHHRHATPYHCYGWMEAVYIAYGHNSIGAIARCAISDKVVGVFPAVLMKTPFVGKQICALPYCDVGYPLADSDDVVEALQQFIQKQLVVNETNKLEIRGVSYHPHNEEDFHNKKVRMLLTLPESSDLLLSSFKSKLRSQIRKAEKNGLHWKMGRNEQLIDHFYYVYARNMRDLGSPAHALKWFKAIVKTYADNAVISIVYNGAEPIGGGIVLNAGPHACIPWASTLREHNSLAPNMLLYWSLLSHCADNGIRQFDFGRSTYLEGTYKFKKQWGALPQLLQWQKLNNKGESVDDSSSEDETPSALREMAEGVWRKLPLKITIMTGSLIRPYISL
ncbi:FemAB family PEP-CTERM system-associated protein [Alteromonas sp. D210916BOD_24]|uniref:GNAT family N-acetyltransferase n=1 Tax=Alteromonas sp. D210916BOD_24 TaxID=3157618 RepID=UPI00399D1E94